MSKDTGPQPSLTPREREVLIELCRPALRPGAFTEPASIREIANALYVSEAAIKQHMLRLYDKFRIHDGSGRRRVLLANKAIERGVVGPNDLNDDSGVETTSHELLAAGHAALDRRAWREAFDNLLKAEEEGAALRADDLTALGEAAIWSGEVEASQAARLRAYNAYVEAGDERNAGLLALALVVNHVVCVRYTVAAGWCNKARRHLEGVPEGVEHGHLAAAESMLLLGDGDFDTALERATEAFELGRKHRSRDLRAIGLVFQASALAQVGRRSDAMPLFDEAMASAATGKLHPLATGLVYCRTLCACMDLFDYRRALDWSAEVDRSMEGTTSIGFPGDCRAHRAQVLAARGEWREAEREARTACAEAKSFDLAHVGLAETQIGVLKLRTGKLDEAEAAFQRAGDLGVTPEPGLSLLHLARGDLDGAARSIASALDQVKSVPLKRAPLLPVQTEIALARGDLETAKAAAADLEEIAHDYGTVGLAAAAHCARGAVAASVGDLEASIMDLREGVRLWLRLGAPYEVARAREILAEVLAAQGNDSASLVERKSAKKAFESLGALADVERLKSKTGLT